MSSPLPITKTVGNLPLNFSGTPKQLFQAIVRRIRGTVDTGNLLIGDTTSTTAPTSDVGPWFDGKQWWFWNVTLSAYTSEVHHIDGINNLTATFIANPTAQRLVYVPDKDGTLLMVNDIYVPRAMIILVNEPLTIDWSVSNNFMHRLQNNARFYMVGSKEGQRISVFVQNASTAFSANWPPEILWPAGLETIMPTSQAGQSHMAEFKFVNINGSIFGECASITTQASPANTVFVGGSTTTTGQEPSTGFHSSASSPVPTNPSRSGGLQP